MSSWDLKGLIYLAHAVCWSFAFLKPSVQRQLTTYSVRSRLLNYYRRMIQSCYTAQLNWRRYLHRKHFLIVRKGIRETRRLESHYSCVESCCAKSSWFMLLHLKWRSNLGDIQWELYLSMGFHCRHEIIPTTSGQNLVKLCDSFFIDLCSKRLFSKKIYSEWILFELWYALNKTQKIQVLWKS